MKSRLILLLALLIILTVAYEDADGAEWSLFVKDNLFEHYYDKESINRTPEKIVQVLIKVVPKGKEGKDILLDIRKKRGFLMGGYEDYHFTVTATEINCLDETRNILESSDFDHKGGILDTVRSVRRKWDKIIPGSRDDFYRKALCK